ncbi:MAG: GYD domain-containing protein [Acidobacteria bacterium]|nr:GYD domain-containing protein [Acidobacteriota bacterium]
MARYVTLGRFRDGTALAQVKERLPKVQDAAKKAGCKLGSVYYTLGPYDFVATLEAPDDKSAVAFMAWYAKLNVAETTTLPAYTPEEFFEQVGRIK